jgi:hypothetical protein
VGSNSFHSNRSSESKESIGDLSQYSLYLADLLAYACVCAFPCMASHRVSEDFRVMILQNFVQLALLTLTTKLARLMNELLPGEHCILTTSTGDLRMISRVVCPRMNRGQPRGKLMVPNKRSTTCSILQRSGSELFSSRRNSRIYMYLCDSSLNSRKGLSEGSKCKTVSPQGARVPGIDLIMIDVF